MVNFVAWMLLSGMCAINAKAPESASLVQLRQQNALYDGVFISIEGQDGLEQQRKDF